MNVDMLEDGPSLFIVVENIIIPPTPTMKMPRFNLIVISFLLLFDSKVTIVRERERERGGGGEKEK